MDRKILFFLILITFSLSANGQSVTSQEILAAEYLNLLENASFEIWENNKPTGWTGFSRTGSVIADNIDRHEGNYSLRIESLADSEYNCVIQEITVKPNTDYVLSCWAKSKNIVKGLNGLGGRIIITKKDGNALKTAAVLEGTTDWKEYKVQFNSGDNSVLKVYAYLYKSTGIVWFDDLLLTGGL